MIGVDARRKVIFDVISDLVGDFLYYGRKGCESLPMGELEDAVAKGEICLDEMVAAFRKGLEAHFR